MVSFLSDYDHTEPGIGLSGLVPCSLPTHHHIPPLSSSELGLLFFSRHELFRTEYRFGWARSLSSPPHLYHSTAPLFPSLLKENLGFLNFPSLVRVRTFLVRNRVTPRPLCCRLRKLRASYPGYRFGWTSFPSLPTHHNHPPSSTGDAQPKHLPCLTPTWVGSTPSPFYPMHRQRLLR